jgi:peptidoglycan/xylan/chitin deacetylase (PgdA/CDA1 family)
VTRAGSRGQTGERGDATNLRLTAAAGALAGAIVFALAWLGAFGGGEDDPAAANPTATPAVINLTQAPTVAPPAATTETPAPGGTPLSAPVDVPILMYHIIGPADRPENEGLATPAEDFARQMSYLNCAGFTPVTVGALFEAFAGTRALPEKPVVLTFDDGWAGQYTYGFPALQEHGFAASFAIVTGFVGGGDIYMTWAQIEEMAATGMEMVSHSVSHPDLGAQDDATVREQITASKAEIESHTGKATDYFVYPAGEPFRSGSEERQAQVVAMLREAGYRGALLANGVYGGQDPARPFELNRVRVSGGEDIATFAGSIDGEDPDAIGC